jgi:hypothetical protein
VGFLYLSLSSQGLLGLVDSATAETRIVPHYSKSLLELYEEAVARYCEDIAPGINGSRNQEICTTVYNMLGLNYLQVLTSIFWPEARHGPTTRDLGAEAYPLTALSKTTWTTCYEAA